MVSSNVRSADIDPSFFSKSENSQPIQKLKELDEKINQIKGTLLFMIFSCFGYKKNE